jgi:hypothetical protein
MKFVSNGRINYGKDAFTPQGSPETESKIEEKEAHDAEHTTTTA